MRCETSLSRGQEVHDERSEKKSASTTSIFAALLDLNCANTNGG